MNLPWALSSVAVFILCGLSACESRSKISNEESMSVADVESALKRSKRSGTYPMYKTEINVPEKINEYLFKLRNTKYLLTLLEKAEKDLASDTKQVEDELKNYKTCTVNSETGEGDCDANSTCVTIMKTKKCLPNGKENNLCELHVCTQSGSESGWPIVGGCLAGYKCSQSYMNGVIQDPLHKNIKYGTCQMDYGNQPTTSLLNISVTKDNQPADGQPNFGNNMNFGNNIGNNNILG